METVTFSTLANGTAELSAESRENYWIIRFERDESTTTLHNLRVSYLSANSKLCKDLLRAGNVLGPSIIKLLRLTPHSEEYKSLWWEIKKSLEAL